VQKDILLVSACIKILIQLGTEREAARWKYGIQWIKSCFVQCRAVRSCTCFSHSRVLDMCLLLKAASQPS